MYGIEVEVGVEVEDVVRLGQRKWRYRWRWTLRTTGPQEPPKLSQPCQLSLIALFWLLGEFIESESTGSETYTAPRRSLCKHQADPSRVANESSNLKGMARGHDETSSQALYGGSKTIRRYSKRAF